MLYRERRSWTEEEDQLLRDAVDLEEPGSINPSKWHAIAKHVPSRTNKDCRKRWFAKMASDVVKGGWAPEEDEKLVQAIEKYGTRAWQTLDKDSADLFSGEDGTRRKESVGVLDLGMSRFPLIFA
ncbi:hypothetical protein HHX47_DHR7000739 [Lentinula edodes]|nr:hypothetical protein HHX47_DHR7000739 [Lentinula edodes]